MSTNLSDIQQAFVRRYMHREGVISVRIRRCDGEMVLFVEVEDPGAVQLPETFEGLPVLVRAGRRAVVASS
jgi:hypothetical protein